MIKKDRKSIIDAWKQKEKSETKEEVRKGGVRFASHSSEEDLVESAKSLNLSPKVQSFSKTKKPNEPVAPIPKSNNKSKIRKSKIRNKTALPSASESSEEDYDSIGHSSNSQSVINANPNSYYGEPSNMGGHPYGEQYYQEQRSVMDLSPTLQAQYSQQYQDPNMYNQSYQNQVYQSQVYGQQPYQNGYGRPVTLLEAQEVNKQNQRQFLQQAKMNPLTHITNDRNNPPQGGLVGAISAIQQHKQQTKAANFNRAMNNSMMSPDYERAQFQSQNFYDPRMIGQPMSPLGQPSNMHNSFYGQEGYYDPSQSEFIQPNGDYPTMQDPSMMYGNNPYYQDDDDVALGTLASLGGKSNAIKPTRINRSKLKDKKKQESDEEELSEPDIPEDILEAFDDFVDKKLQMKPYSYVLPAKAYDSFVDWCQDEDIEDYLVPDIKVFDYMMEHNGFVKKKKPSKGGKQDDDHAPNTKWWHNIALVD